MVSEIRYCIKHLHTLRRKYRLHPSQRIRANIAALETTIRIYSRQYLTSMLQNWITNLVLLKTLLHPKV